MRASLDSTVEKVLVRILLVDDHEVVRRGVRALLEAQPGFSVCGEACDGRTAVELARLTTPDLVIMDIGLPLLNGTEATRRIVQKIPGVRVIILSMHHSEQLVREALSAGAAGYVLKSDAAKDLLAAIEAVRSGVPFYSALVAELTGALPEEGEELHGKVRSPLTPREREILQLLAEGCSNKDVALVLGISVKTAETHRARIMRKLQVDSVADLVRYAIRNGVIQA